MCLLDSGGYIYLNTGIAGSNAHIAITSVTLHPHSEQKCLQFSYRRNMSSADILEVHRVIALSRRRILLYSSKTYETPSLVTKRVELSPFTRSYWVCEVGTIIWLYLRCSRTLRLMFNYFYFFLLSKITYTWLLICKICSLTMEANQSIGWVDLTMPWMENLHLIDSRKN